jgi:signal transduction histidine kinase/DNA-binding NarL/FixJ family response regulator
VAGRQRIDRVRRQYNQWVANQTLEDYALRFTAKSARRWSAARVANTALGAISFLALEAIGGTITLKYGAANATAAILVVSIIIFFCGLPIAYYAAKCGIDIDLLTRGAGFGYIGSTITSLIYASFTFIFFAIEAVILATALDMCFGIPRPIGYMMSAVVIIPLVTYGITLISRFQLWTQPLWIILHIMPFAAIAWANPHSFEEWRTFAGEQGDAGGQLDLLLFGTAASVVFSLIAQIGEQVDFLRFLPRDRRTTSRTSWWTALLAAGPGWIIFGALKLLLGSFLAIFALSHGLSSEQAAEPAHMYLEAFRYVLSQPDLALALTGTFVVLSQIKINVTNAYAGSIAWSNFFSRLTHSHPGRVVWLVFNVVVALLLMEIGVYKTLEQTLALYSNVAIAWVGALVADLVINKPMGLRPPHMEFKRAHLYDINPVGVGAMTIATIVSISAFYGLFGPTAKALSAFVALATAFVAAPLIAWATGGKYYIARKPKRSWQNIDSIQCCICEHSFEPEDMASCPAYGGPICSLCCSLDARCQDLCKPHARIGAQVSETLGKLMPQPIYARINSQLGHYFGVFAISAGLVGLVLGLIYLQTSAFANASDLLADVLWKVFFALIIIIAVVAWLFVLAQQSRRAAEQETRRQTTLLIQEIDAHKRTDAELQRAKEVAEAANLAKSRYVVGLSHELRSPLNAISGYAQLLEQDNTLQTGPRDQVRVVRRSADHLSGLIDGILDISKIEAGRLYLSRDEVRLTDFLDQLVGMFRLQAAAKGVDFVFKRPAVLPVVVYADEKRLRQVLINLLSNAIKFTQAGSVQFIVRYRSPVAEFEVTDTGPGIQPADLERIFAPFERGALGVSQPQTGTGLGLTISRLLAGVMGGDIKVTSALGIGSTFHVKLLLSEVINPRRDAPVEARVYGYGGPRKTILITDDDPTHRDLLREVLAPLGFILLSAPDGPGCLALAQHCRPDLFLLDISMAGMDGWTVAETLRANGHHQARILMVSASALEAHGAPLAQPFHDGYLMKPIDIPRLLETVRQLLRIEWQYEADQVAQPLWKLESGSRPPVKYVEELIGLGQLGYVRAIQLKLDQIGTEHPEHADFVSQMRALVDRFDLDQYMATLKTLHSHDH